MRDAERESEPRRFAMKMITMSLVAAAAVCAPRAVRADDPPSPYSYGWHDSSLKSDFGISATAGGGVSGFTDKTMRDTVSQTAMGLWDLKLTFGSHTPLAIDVGYTGTAADINALTGGQSATLVGTTVEGALRYNILPHFAWNPYVFAGAGWQRYDITGANFRLSDSGMNSNDNSVVFPMGAGLQFRDKSGIVVDLRGTFRANTNYGLVLENTSSTNYAPMHTWQASGALGYEF
jgi:hypothetical protein